MLTHKKQQITLCTRLLHSDVSENTPCYSDGWFDLKLQRYHKFGTGITVAQSRYRYRLYSNVNFIITILKVMLYMTWRKNVQRKLIQIKQFIGKSLLSSETPPSSLRLTHKDDHSKGNGMIVWQFRDRESQCGTGTNVFPVSVPVAVIPLKLEREHYYCTSQTLATSPAMQRRASEKGGW